MPVIGAVIVFAVGAQLAVANAALEKCRALDREFDTRAMPKPCQAAADDTTLSLADRVEALRRLAFAQILNGDEALAEPTFLRMLVFSPSAELPADAGPRFRSVFHAARTRFASEGKVTASFAPFAPLEAGRAGPLPVKIDVNDKLGRVAGARILARVAGAGETTGSPVAPLLPVEERLARSELSPGMIRFTGTLPEPRDLPSGGAVVAWEVVFDGWDGKPVDATPAVAGEVHRSPSSGAHDGEGASWPWVVGGTAGGLAVIGGIVGGTVYCFTAGPCRTQDAFVRVQIRQERP